MKFRQLPKEKRQKLALIGLITLATLAAVWFGLMGFQRARIKQLAQTKANSEAKVKTMSDAIERAGQLETELPAQRKLLGDLESDIASGDLYAWVIRTVRDFKTPYKVDI